jgi:hypothetical protein
MDRETRKILDRYPPKPRRQAANHQRTMATRTPPDRPETWVEASITLVVACIGASAWVVALYHLHQILAWGSP